MAPPFLLSTWYFQNHTKSTNALKSWFRQKSTSKTYISSQISLFNSSHTHSTKKNLRQPGIEPGSTAWKAAMLTIIPLTLLEQKCKNKFCNHFFNFTFELNLQIMKSFWKKNYFLRGNGKILEAIGHYCLVHSSQWDEVISEGELFSFGFFLLANTYLNITSAAF